MSRKDAELHNFYMEIIKSLIATLDIKDHSICAHSNNVTKYSIAIAKEIGLTKADIRNIKLAAQLHDLGKIGISDSILYKKETLSENDWKQIKLHPTKSAEILKPLKYLHSVVEIVKQHHEKFNGKGGYPKGKKGNDILLGARILAVADAYDAMVNERPYRKAFTKEKAINELKRCSKIQFDPKIVKAFLQVIKKNRPI
jgi:putative nucleotidyltransferase with HDIG domain